MSCTRYAVNLVFILELSTDIVASHDRGAGQGAGYCQAFSIFFPAMERTTTYQYSRMVAIGLFYFKSLGNSTASIISVPFSLFSLRMLAPCMARTF